MRESVDVGIGIMHGPWGCPTCRWSSDSQYDFSDLGRSQIRENGWILDQWGVLTPPRKVIDIGPKDEGMYFGPGFEGRGD